jgi:hypothetical protein
MTALDVIQSSGAQGAATFRRRDPDGPDGRLSGPRSDADRDALADRHQPDGGEGDESV